jgi:NAD(P)-dependent dehydrogenase (short-subunit alcohol dehydrogenase family)
VATPEGAQRIVQTAVKEFGKLDILINNAGILRDKDPAQDGPSRCGTP